MVREPGLETFRGAIGRGSRKAKERVPDQATIWLAVLQDLEREAAERLASGAVTASGAIPNPDSIYDVDAATERLRRATEPGRVGMVNDTLAGVSSVWGASFDVTNPLIANLLTGMGQRITRVAEWQRSGIMNVVQHGYDQGHSIVKIAGGIWDGDTGTGITSAARAAMIARTELTQATQGASLASAQTLDIAKFKQWLAAADSRTRADHSYVSGQVVKLRDNFNVNGHPMQHPGDPAGPAKETVHCRCVLVYTDNPDGLSGVPKHEDIQRQAHDPEIIADDQRWLRSQRSRYNKIEGKSAAAQAEAKRLAAEEAKLSTPGVHHRRDLTPDQAYERHGSAAVTKMANGKEAHLPEYRPKAGSEFVVTTRSGHRIDVFHERHSPDGFVPDEIYRDSMMRRVEELRAHLDAMPSKLLSGVKSVRLMAGRNPGDVFWSVMRDREFTAAATGGNGRINFWGARKADYGTLTHEAGHSVAGSYEFTLSSRAARRDSGLPVSWWDQKRVWGGPPDGPKWLSLARADSKAAYAQWTEDVPPPWRVAGGKLTMHPQYDGHRLNLSGGWVTEYGADSVAEDFAESVSLWAFDRRYGYIGTMQDGTRVRFKDLWPRRAGYLSRLLGGK